MSTTPIICPDSDLYCPNPDLCSTACRERMRAIAECPLTEAAKESFDNGPAGWWVAEKKARDLERENAKLAADWKEKCIEADTMRQHHANAERANDALVAENAGLRDDKARLDWLDREAKPKAGTYPVAALTVKAGYNRNSSQWVNIIGTAREAIDAARTAHPEGDA